MVFAESSTAEDSDEDGNHTHFDTHTSISQYSQQSCDLKHINAINGNLAGIKKEIQFIPKVTVNEVIEIDLTESEDDEQAQNNDICKNIVSVKKETAFIPNERIDDVIYIDSSESEDENIVSVKKETAFIPNERVDDVIHIDCSESEDE